MTTMPACAKCGNPLPSDAPEGLCPKCLVVAGLMSQVGTLAEQTIDFSPSQLVAQSQSPATSLAPAIQRLFGGYRIIRPLGQGGMGTVYEAEEDASGRRLALKVLAHSLDSEQARTRFFREGRLAASVNHPNSVYIFGTEEINDLPVITMELAPGGTLQDLVKRNGPLPIPEAVDAILQIIAGLEAAAAAGVLHRDVKPSNCFIDPDGTIKIGDFGLSISTLARGEHNITISGAVLGTPAYASPEQLRGDELDPRSDMYAVGVTLFFLLTGQTPFTAANMVKLLATVLERPADSPRKLRPEIPESLAQVVLRCLAKQPAQRFKNYAELRQSLLPFTSAALQPAALSIRFLAGFIDSIGTNMVNTAFLMLVALYVPTLLNDPNAPPLAQGPLQYLPLLLTFFYYALFEGWWGASLGKAICRLRVVDPRRNAPSFPRAFARAAVFKLLPAVIGLLTASLTTMWVGPARSFSIPKDLGKFELLGLISLSEYIIIYVSLFATMRRTNGFAGLHDLISGTRVIVKPIWQTRTAAPIAAESAQTSDATPRIGPYHVLAELPSSPAARLFQGFDNRLFRSVWIRQLPDGAPEVPPALRMMGRRGRLRWLGGKRARGENWDAYEALTGQPLTALLQHRQSWKRVRFWLLDIAEELGAGLKSQSLPAVLALDRVWITADGRAKLLDFPAPGAAPDRGALDLSSASGAPPAPCSDRDAQLFLKTVAIAALEGRPANHDDITSRAPSIPLPLHARNFVSELPRFPTFDALLTQFHDLINRIAEVTRLRKLTLLTGALLPCIIFGPVLLLFFIPAIRHIQAQQQLPQIMELQSSFDQLESLKARHDPVQDSDANVRAYETYLADHSRAIVNTPAVWNGPYAKLVITPDHRKSIESLVAAHASDTPEQIKVATEQVQPILAPAASEPQLPPDLRIKATMILSVAVIALFVMTGIPALIAALLFRGGLILHGLGLTIVTRRGAPASRLRIFWRACITWCPVLWMVLGPALILPILPPLAAWLSAIIITVASLPILAFFAAAIWSLWKPERGLQDYLAGTRMVPC